MSATQPTIKCDSHRADRQTALLTAGVGALERLSRRLALDDDARAKLVNGHPGSGTTVLDRLERISHVLGIYRAATALFGRRDSTLAQWLHANNTAPPFAGLPPIEVILEGRKLEEVRGYLECQLVG